MYMFLIPKGIGFEEKCTKVFSSINFILYKISSCILYMRNPIFELVEMAILIKNFTFYKANKCLTNSQLK